MANNGNGQQTGRIVQIIGPVVDVEFSNNYLPPIYQALRITSEGFDVDAVGVDPRHAELPFERGNRRQPRTARSPVGTARSTDSRWACSKKPANALRHIERQLNTLKSWNIINVVNAMVRVGLAVFNGDTSLGEVLR